MSTKRKQMLDAVQTCLQAILTADDYHTNAGTTVTLEPHKIQNDASSVIGVLLDEQVRATDAAVRSTHRLTTFIVAIRVPTDLDDAQAMLDLIVDDVERAMSNRQSAYPAGVSFPDYVGMRPIPPPAGAKWIGATIRYQSNVPIR